MAVYTVVERKEVEEFLSLYNIGELHSFAGILEGVENSNYRLKTSQSSYILTLYERRVDEKDLPFFLDFMAHLYQNSIICPQPLVQKNGAMIGRLKGRCAAIISLLEGDWVRTPEARHCAQVGQALAQMHRAAESFPMRRENSLSVSSWRSLWQSVVPHVDSYAPEMRKPIENWLDRLEQKWPEGLPKAIIHADLFPDNVLFSKDKLSGLIDFYFACYDFLAYDFAICLNAWCFDENLQYCRKKAEALLRGYESVRPFSEHEKESLPLLAQGAAMRFFMTRLYDWFYTPKESTVKKKDPRAYWVRLCCFDSIKDAASLWV